MRNETGQPVRLADYRPPDHRILDVRLDVSLDPTATRVVSTLTIAPNPAGRVGAPLVLDGDGLVFLSARLDGEDMPDGRFSASPSAFRLDAPPDRPFTLSIETEIDPSANTQLMGLYRSSGAYCTQCEAEGFRRITYFLDRPDVLATYTTRLEADKATAPILLGNGNPVEAGDLPDGRHFAVWRDPFPKPCYLFALVAGDLAEVADTFVTMSGRTVRLGIFVEHGKADRCAYAMDALKRSMRWDETTFGREYDLDVFNIVAVSDFNMGAMENKGLNIFNDKYVLASPDTATDQDYAAIEAIIAHEYFHNWTGNRITCRDWFQLCVKEGLTVFRDQEFSSDMRSRAVKRIADVRLLMSQQFPEDAGPLAHPVRPEVYREINNFYTATVYEKGAEVIRMLMVLVGPEAFRAGMTLYFDRHDGGATTVEDFIACFAEASGQDLLGQFFLWYRQSGTPAVDVAMTHDPRAALATLTLRQTLPATPGQADKLPMAIPLAFGLVGEDGRDRPLLTEDGEAAPDVIVLDRPEARFTFSGHPTRPVLSINRGFSSPVRLSTDLTEADLVHLARCDRDPYNRWQSGQTLALRVLMAASGAPSPAGRGDEAALGDVIAAALDDARHDPAFAAQALTLPSEADVAREIGKEVDPEAILAARRGLKARLGLRLRSAFEAAHAHFAAARAFTPDAASAGARAVANVALDFLAATGDVARAAAAFAAADNMTNRLAALGVLAQHDRPERGAAFAAFQARHGQDALAMDKWYALQAAVAEPATVERVRAILDAPDFPRGNPNRLRALVGSFATLNPSQFHRADGEGYRLLADVAVTTDARNPQVAARLLSAFRSWRAMEPTRRRAARDVLQRVAAHPRLSTDVADIVQRSLAD